MFVLADRVRRAGPPVLRPLATGPRWWKAEVAIEDGEVERQPEQQLQRQQLLPEEPVGTDQAKVQNGAEAGPLVQPLEVALLVEEESLAPAEAGAECERPGNEAIQHEADAVASPHAAGAVALGPCDLMPLPPHASEAMARAFKVLSGAFSRHECKACCPEGHRLAIGEPRGSRTKACGNCHGRITGPFLTCERGNFKACLRCGLRVSAQGT